VQGKFDSGGASHDLEGPVHPRPRLAKCCDASIFASAAKFHMEPHDVVRSSVARIKDSFWFYFSKLV